MKAGLAKNEHAVLQKLRMHGFANHFKNHFDI